MSLLEVKVRGIGDVLAKKFMDAGITTAEQLSIQRPDEVKSIMNCSIAVAKTIINNAKEVSFSGVDIFNADTYQDNINANTRFIKTGCDGLDEMLGGGYRSMSSYGYYGRFSTGKSQAANTAIVKAMEVGLDVGIVETEPRTIYPDRLKQIAKARNIPYDGKKIHIIPATKVSTVFAQFKAYQDLDMMATKENWDLGLIVVDSFNAKFRRAYAGREMFPERSQEYGRHIDFLEEMAKKFNAVTFLTFQVGVTPAEDGEKADRLEFHIPFYPVGGTLVQHNIQTWIALMQTAGGDAATDIYEARLADSNFLPKGSCKFIISDKGIEDF